MLTYRAINNTKIRHAGRDITAATLQDRTIYIRVKPAKLLPHTAHSGLIINRTGLTSWAFTRWRDQHTSDKVAHCSIYRPRKDEKLSWPSSLTYRGRLTHISGHPSAVGRAWDRESSPVKDQRSTTVQRNQQYVIFFRFCWWRHVFT